MPMKPGKDESQSEFMSRCVPDMIGEGEDKRPKEQAVAICLDIWRNKNKAAIKQVPEPDPGESHSEYMDRCLEETDDEEACQMAWEDRKITEVVHKTHAGQVDGAEYILSSETADRLGDIIKADGWRLDNLKRNPIALAFHRSDFPIGRWRNLRVEGTELRGHLELAPPGTSERIDEIRRLIDAGILKATSVGFRPLKHEPLNPESPRDGTRFIDQELVEVSMVSVPANPDTLAIAKSLDISRETMGLVFAKHGEKEPAVVARGSTGKQADPPPKRKGSTMSTPQNIVELQNQLNMLRDGLQQHRDNLDNDNVTDEQMNKTDDFHAKIAKKSRQLEQEIATEKLIGGTIIDAEAHEIRMPTRRIEAASSTALTPLPRVYPEIAKKDQPGDNLFRALTCLVKLQGEKYLGRKSHLDVIRDTYGENEKVRAVFEGVVGKAAALPAVTTPAQTGWAPELVRTEYAAWMESLQPAGITMQLLGRGLQFTFGSNGIISIPSRVSTPTIHGSFVGEALPIPVRQGAFTAITLVPKKLAVITVFSREISEHSTPAIEGLLRNAIVEDTAVALDTVLLDATAVSAIRPAGLRNGVSTLTPTAGGGFTAVIGDLKLLINALVTSTLGNIRSPVLLMSPGLQLALRLTVAPNGTFAFPSVEQGSLLGIPIIVSPNVNQPTADTIYLIDAADLVSASGPPNFSVSDSATVHMEDTNPLAIGTAGTPATVAAPTRSFWQTDTLGIRMIMNMNWAMRRTGMIQYVTPTTWD